MKSFSSARIAQEAMWAAAGHIGAALAALIGLRVLTEIASPTVYGSFALALGIVALGMNSFCMPITQAAIKYFPELAAIGATRDLRRCVRALLFKYGALVSGVMVLGFLCRNLMPIDFGNVDVLSLSLLILLLSIDTNRTYRIVFLSAAREQKRCSIFLLLDAWLRPTVCILLAAYIEPSMNMLLAGYAGGGVAAEIIVRSVQGREAIAGEIANHDRDSKITSDIHRYSRPLVPVTAVGWVSGVGDRYILAGVLGLHSAGIYSAAYGLVSRPFLMLFAILEQAIRPHYNEQVALRRHRTAARLLRKWLIAVLGGGLLMLLVIAVFNAEIAELFLAEDFRSGANLLPWIAAGYLALILSNVFEKTCYAYGRPGLVTATQMIGAVVSISLSYIGILYFGLTGAAVAVLIGFGVQYGISVLTAALTLRSVRNHIQQSVNTERSLKVERSARE